MDRCSCRASLHDPWLHVWLHPQQWLLWPQVVGRVSKGAGVLAALNSLPIDASDWPRQRVTVAACGPLDAQGNHETVEEAAAQLARKQENQQAAARLKAEAATAKQAVL